VVGEPDPEIQHLVAASVRVNLGVDFLPGSVGYDGTGNDSVGSLPRAAPWCSPDRCIPGWPTIPGPPWSGC
jgi:hypothetical protein